MRAEGQQPVGPGAACKTQDALAERYSADRCHLGAISNFILLEQPDAEEMLGFCYRFGTGLPINRKFAREHYRKAVAIGDEWSVSNDAATHAAEMLIGMDDEEASVGHFLGVP